MFLGLASFVVWTQGGFQEQTGPLVLYAVNLALNLAWMPVSPFTTFPCPENTQIPAVILCPGVCKSCIRIDTADQSVGCHAALLQQEELQAGAD